MGHQAIVARVFKSIDRCYMPYRGRGFPEISCLSVESLRQDGSWFERSTVGGLPRSGDPLADV